MSSNDANPKVGTVAPRRRLEVGFPIRKFTDQSPFAAPHDLSQRTTSFIASQRQGIHRILLRHLIALIIDAPRSHSRGVKPQKVQASGRPPRQTNHPAALAHPRHGADKQEPRPRSGRPPVQEVGPKDQLLRTHPRAQRSSQSPTRLKMLMPRTTAGPHDPATRRLPDRAEPPSLAPRQVGCVLSSRCHVGSRIIPALRLMQPGAPFG